MGKDLGTYHVRVEFQDGRGYIQEWTTGKRYTLGSDTISPLNSQIIWPAWESEQEVIESILYQYLEGNYSCDCNRRSFYAASQQQECPEPNPCSASEEEFALKKLTLIRPNASQLVLWEKQ